MSNSHEQRHDHDLGFSHDLPRLIGRRRLLALMGGVGALALSGLPAAGLDCVALPWETSGPYPADGTNVRDGQVVNALVENGIIRSDLRRSFGALSREADGVQLDLELTLLDADGCTPLVNHAIYLWHCDADGHYSLYDVTDANYLRGVGVSDAEGKVKFTTIFPACYDGRWPHMHFEIFETLDDAVSGEAAVLTAQIAMPQDEAATLYGADTRYAASLERLGRVSLATDNVFGDNTEDELAQETLQLTGDMELGYRGRVTIPVDFTAERRATMAPPPANGLGGPPPAAQ